MTGYRETLAEQTTRRLINAGITGSDPAIARLVIWNQLMRELHKAVDDCTWPTCPRHASRIRRHLK